MFNSFISSCFSFFKHSSVFLDSFLSSISYYFSKLMLLCSSDVTLACITKSK
jgi:hypothetical protein